MRARPGRGMTAPPRKAGRGMPGAGDGDREPGDGFMDDPTEARPNTFCMEISIPRLLCPACRKAASVPAWFRSPSKGSR